jgi:hypothetical protein
MLSGNHDLRSAERASATVLSLEPSLTTMTW